jgi:hypothetical protein
MQVERKEIKPLFKPIVKSAFYTENFDVEFTTEPIEQHTTDVNEAGGEYEHLEEYYAQDHGDMDADMDEGMDRDARRKRGSMVGKDQFDGFECYNTKTPAGKVAIQRRNWMTGSVGKSASGGDGGAGGTVPVEGAADERV